MNEPLILWVDLFCGAGGVTEGICRSKIGKVIACVNHDKNAINSHAANHPDAIHYTEDIRTLDLTELTALVKRMRGENHIICLWASLECTNFSNAKGGAAKNPDSRTLAEHLYRYTEALNPDAICIENVREFLSWGPLDEHNNPIKKLKGVDYLRWVQHTKDYGYDYDYRILDAADYGAYTSRKRLFIQFMKPHIPILWPEHTHTKFPQKFPHLKKWNAVRDVLDLQDIGNSIFKRKKELAEKTLKRIYAGLIKYAAETYFVKYHGSSVTADIKEPSCTLTSKDRLALVTSLQWIDKAYSGSSNHSSIAEPCGSMTTKDKMSLMSAVQFVDKSYGSGSHNHSGVDTPAGSLTTSNKLSLVSATRQFMVNPQFSNGGSSIHKPCFTLIARMDKASPYLITPFAGEEGDYTPFIKGEPEVMVQIKTYMRERGITDICLRMLRIPELKRIQGFGTNYTLIGTEAEQKKYIGNSVPPDVTEALSIRFYQAVVIAYSNVVNY